MNSLYPLMEKQEEQEGEDTNLKLYIFSSSSQVVAAAAAAASSSSSSSQLAFATCFSTSATQHNPQRVNLHHHLLQESHHQLQHDLHQAEKSIGGSREDSSEVIFSATSLVKSSTREALERSRSDIDHQEQQLDEVQIKKQDNHNGSAAKYWMSSKMRLMQKMMINTDKKVGANSDHQKAATRNNNNQGHGGKWEITGRTSCNSNGHNDNNGVRVCSDCNTTTTPLWRSGPQGPKSLCNACGIRQRKARRAMVEAANGGGGGTVVVGSEAPSGKEVHKEKKSRLSWHGDGAIVADQVKNECNKNMTDNSSDSQSEGTNDGVSFDRHNFTLRLSKSGSAFGRAFPRDEEEAAILLMELSCGLVHTC